MKKTSAALLPAAALLVAPTSLLAQAWPKSPVPVPARPADVPPGMTAPKVTDIWVVFKTHCDLGYTASAEAVNTKYRVAMMDNAIRLMEADKARPPEERFKWTIAGWPMARNILGPLQDPARKAKVEEGLRSGAFAVHALPVSLHTDATDAEELTRGLIFSSEVARKYGLPMPVSAKMTDVPAHGWIMTSVLAHAGVGFLQIGCNYSNRGPLLPHLFKWEAPDGSSVICNYTPAYGSEVTPPKGWPAKNYLAVVMTHDNEGPPSPGEVAAARAAVAKMPGVKLHFATMDDFHKALLAENPALPTVRGDMVDPWIHGVSSMPEEARLMRNASPATTALGALDTLMRASGVNMAIVPGMDASDAPAPLAEIYERAVLHAEHTYGGNTPGWGFWSDNGSNRGTERYLYGDVFRKAREKGYYTKFEKGFDDKRAYIRKADAKLVREIGSRLNLLAASVKAEGDRVVVFNPLPWPRSGLVEISGKPGLALFAKDVPAGGWKTFPLSDAKPVGEPVKLDGTVFETARFKVTVDPVRGGLASLVDKATGRELVDTTSPYALGQYLHERFSQAQTWDYYNRYCTMNNAAWGTVKPNMPGDAKYAALTPAKWSATLRRGPLADTLSLTAGDTLGLAKSVTVEFSFPADSARVGVEWRETGKVGDPIPEGGWLCFPVAANSPRFLLGRNGGLMDLAKDQIVGGNRHLYGINSGVSVTSPDGRGVGLCSPDSPTMSFGEPGLWKYTFDYLPTTPTVFVHLYNNMWNTNFPLWIEGDLRCRVALWPQINAESFVVPSWETRAPLLVGLASGAAGTLPTASHGVALSRDGVLVTAFGPDPDGNSGTLLRLWNQTAESGALTVTLPVGFKATRAQPVDLRGRKTGDAIPVKAGSFAFELGKYAPASFVLE